MDYAAELQQQRCKACWNADGFNFQVSDEIWSAVVPAALQNHVVCLRCFDRFAAAAGVAYAHRLGEIHFAGDRVSLTLRVALAGTSG